MCGRGMRKGEVGQDRTKKIYTWKRRNSFKGIMIHDFFSFLLKIHKQKVILQI